MEYYSGHIGKLIEELSKLPSIGQKTATRLAFSIIQMPPEQAHALADSITAARDNLHFCKECFNICDSEICPICANSKRNHKQIMVVESPRDLAAYEKTKQ